MPSPSPPTPPTRFLILSDTHGKTFSPSLHWSTPSAPVDVAIHCGDLTQESKLAELEAVIRLLSQIPAELRLVIAGNRDITLDDAVFRRHVAAAGLQGDEAVDTEYGVEGQARGLFEGEEARRANVWFLDEGVHRFTLKNGVEFCVYASPYTPRKESGMASSNEAGWAYQYERRTNGHIDRAPDDTSGHDFDIPPDTDIVITHGPALGVLDQTSGGKSAGCPELFASIARARPLLHCFGHVHGSWGAKMVSWRDTTSTSPSHFTDIDNDRSGVLERLANLKRGEADDEDEAGEKRRRLEEYRTQGFCPVGERPVGGRQTMFVNAAVEGVGTIPAQPPLVVELDLPRK